MLFYFILWHKRWGSEFFSPRLTLLHLQPSALSHSMLLLSPHRAPRPGLSSVCVFEFYREKHIGLSHWVVCGGDNLTPKFSSSWPIWLHPLSITFSTKQLNFRISVWRNNRNDTFNVHPKAQIQHSNYPQKRSNSKNLCFLYPCIGCWLKHNQCRCFSLTWWTIIVCFFILAVMGMLTGQAFPSLFLRSASGFSLSSQELESALNLTFDPISHMQTHLHRVMNGLSVTCIWIRDGHISVFPKGIVPSISTWTNIYLNHNWSQGSTLLIFSNIE